MGLLCLNSKSKGQFFSYDAIVASAVFLIALSLILVYWQGIRTGGEGELARESARLSEKLMGTGVPQNWERTGEVGSIGLVEGESNGVLSIEKLVEFRKMSGDDYVGTKEKLGIGNEYWIEISGKEIDCFGACSFGKEPPENAERSSAIRLVVLNGKPASLRATLWKESIK